ncbi:MAG: acylphosphatase, partial [Tepidiformaceae bacterium]
DILIPERRRVVIQGKVRGVAFLLWLRTVANSLDLSGSARALPDGRCEAIVQGDKALVKQFVIACKRGPAEARVDAVEQEVQPVDAKCVTFVVIR